MASNATAARDLLEAAFPGRVVAPGAAGYAAEQETPWSQTCWTPAAAYVQLQSAREVADALAAVRKAGARFAVRSTGHNPNAGFSSAGDTAVVLDVRRLQSKELAEDGVARVGAGNTWGEVYGWLEEKNLSAIGGREQQVGVSGFLLGGGMGALPNIYGLGADGIKGVEIVLADGTILNASKESHPDLIRSLKGGGSNFGIVTRFDLETHPLLKVQYTVNIYNPEDYVEIKKATIKVQEAAVEDPKVGLFTNFNNGFVAVGLIYGDWPGEQPAAYAPFNELKSLLTTAMPTTNGTLFSFANAVGHKEEDKKRYVGTVTTRVSQEVYEVAFKAWQTACKQLPEGAVLHYTIQPVGPACVKAGEDRGGNTMGLESVPQCWFVFTCEWPRETSDDAAARSAVDAAVQSVQAAAASRSALLGLQCMTFANDSQKPLRSYGEANGKRLLETAAKYDADKVFQDLQHHGFLLRNSL